MRTIYTALTDTRQLQQQRTQILPENEFLLQLHKEQARTDRTEIPFTLISLDIKHEPDIERDPEAMTLLAECTAKRTRISDTKGWLNGCVAMILPNTQATTAPIITKAITELFLTRIAERGIASRIIPQITYQTTTYPSSGPLPSPDKDPSPLPDTKIFTGCS